MQGIVLIDKPVGWTSFDVVNFIRRIVANSENKKPKHVKVGHSGTLDPFATGLLIIMIGKDYTRQAEQFTKLEKSYVADILLGKISSTGDTEGEIQLQSTVEPSIVEVKSVVNSFQGTIQQTPPIFSAIKINGKRAYDIARSGKSVDIPSRKVTIHSIDMIRYTYPDLKIACTVSSGTYIRSLAVSIGVALGTGAYTESLRRTKIGRYSIDDAISVKDFDVQKLQNALQTNP